MRRSPADPVRRSSIRHAVTQCVRTEEGFYFIGFDWEPRVCVLGGNVFERARLLSHTMSQEYCFRAIVRVYRIGPGQFQTVILDIGGDAVYRIRTTLTKTKTRLFWDHSEPLDRLEMLSLLPQPPTERSKA